MAEAPEHPANHMEIILSSIQENVRSIQESIDVAREVLRTPDDAEMTEISLEEGTTYEEPTDASLSEVSKYAIQTSTGPLEPEDLKKFLMKEVFGKPKPNVLPIVRQYTQNVEGLMGQLNHVKSENNQAHLRYKDELRRLDVNLNRRITTLTENIMKELKKEADERRRQQSMDAFVTREHN